MSDADDPRSARSHEGRTIRDEVLIDATPDAIWDAWARAESIREWFVDEQEGDMRAGGEVTWVFRHFGYRFPLRVFAAKRGALLRFGDDGDPDQGRLPALMEVFLEREGGRTRLRIANSGFQEGAAFEDEYEGTKYGWVAALAVLRHWLERGAPRGRAHLFAMRPASFEYRAALARLGTCAGLASWLARSVEAEREDLGVGDALALDLGAAGTLRGEVLVRTPREVLMTWPEQGGLLAAKAFKAGPSRMVALDANLWGPAAATPRDDLQGHLDAAVERLAALLP